MPQISATENWKKTEWKKAFSPSPPSTGDKYDRAILLELMSVHGLTQRTISRILLNILSPAKKPTCKDTAVLHYILTTRSARIFSRCIYSPGLASSDFFLWPKAKIRARSGFAAPGHPQMRFGKSVKDHRQRLCYRRSATATVMKKVCLNWGWIG
jgi:hypothetical protein